MAVLLYFLKSVKNEQSQSHKAKDFAELSYRSFFCVIIIIMEEKIVFLLQYSRKGRVQGVHLHLSIFSTGFLR